MARHATGPSPHTSLLAGSLAHWRQRPPVDPLALVLELADGRTPVAARNAGSRRQHTVRRGR